MIFSLKNVELEEQLSLSLLLIPFILVLYDFVIFPPSFVIEGRTTIRIGLYFNLISVQVRSGRRSKVNKDFIFGDMKVPGIAVVILRLTLEQHLFIANQLQLPPGYWDGG